MKSFFKLSLLFSLFFIFLGIFSSPVFASEGKIFTAQFVQQTNLNFNSSQRKSNEEYEKLNLDEAEKFYSGMIYGYSFTLYPKHYDRKISQICEILPNERTIDNNRLKIYQSTLKNGLYSSYIRYDLNSVEERYLEAWNKDKTINATGKAKISFFDLEKMDSFDKALNIAITSSLKKSMNYKPRKIEGFILLKEPPRFFFKSGYIITVVKISIKVKDIKNFSDF